ncbi:MAG: DUF892 family protein [Verrucomicrobiota bacterium]|nr:DUF892 family protein [Verrucomicrobiota bacterium]
MTQTEQILRWMNDAYSMEIAISEILKKHVKEARLHPHIEARLQQHLLETESHAFRMRSAIERLGGTVAAGKAMASDLFVRAEAMMGSFFKDAVVKNMIADFTTEHFEIACYTSLKEAAARAQLYEVISTCDEILSEEKRMADFLKEQIPLVTSTYLNSFPEMVPTGNA